MLQPFTATTSKTTCHSVSFAAMDDSAFSPLLVIPHSCTGILRAQACFSLSFSSLTPLSYVSCSMSRPVFVRISAILLKRQRKAKVESRNLREGHQRLLSKGEARVWRVVPRENSRVRWCQGFNQELARYGCCEAHDRTRGSLVSGATLHFSFDLIKFSAWTRVCTFTST